MRLGLLITVPAAVCVGSMASSWAQSLERWADGDTLSADALNANFAALEARIAALADASNAPLTLATADARYDDLRWALLHAAAVGACAGSPSSVGELAVAETIPRPPERDCNDVCEEALAATGADFPNAGSSGCIAAVSVGQISTERATGAISVGHGYR